MKRGSTFGLATVITMLVVIGVLLSSCSLFGGNPTPTPTPVPDSWAQIKASGKIINDQIERIEYRRIRGDFRPEVNTMYGIPVWNSIWDPHFVEKYICPTV